MLRIDLLPSHFAAARAAKTLLVVMVIILLVTILGCFGFLMLKKQELARVTRERDEAKRKADEVRRIEQEAQEKENLAAPIDAKVTFIEDADGCGEQWWDAFDKINRYIYARARVTAFRIQAPNTVHFEVEVPDTTSCGRFVLNLIRCPDITNIRIGGAPPAGPGVGPNARASAGGMGGMAGMPGGEGMMGGMPGMVGPGGMGMGGPGGSMPGMSGPAGGMPGMGAGTPSPSTGPSGVIRLSVDANLVKPLSTPAPGGGGGAAGAAGGMPGMGGGMPMMGGGMPGMGGSMPGAGGGMPGPGAAGAGPPGGAAKAPGPPARGEGGAKGGLGRRGADADME